MKILVLGANGMLGHAVHRVLAAAGHDVVGTVRGAVPANARCRTLAFRSGVDAAQFDSVVAAIEEVRPQVVINALGVIKQRADAADEWNLIQINSAFPRRLNQACELYGTKLIHFSTDCVFSGAKGNYRESDLPDGTDWYGVSKFLGETGGTSLTLRTSIIGRGLEPNNSLVDWFLAQHGKVTGYSSAIFSGLPVDEVGRFLATYLERGLMEMCGLYHLSVAPIAKYDLLCLLKQAWERNDITVEASADFVIDRSLDSTRLREQLGYVPAPWPALVNNMFKFNEV